MSDTTSGRMEPGIGSAQRRPEFLAVPPPSTGHAPQPHSPLIDRHGLDQLSRIEEKTSRVEEKFARSEALLLRVEATFEESLSHFQGVARQADLESIEKRLRGIPGYGALLFVGILSAVLGAVLAILALKYGIPGLFQPLLTSAPAAPGTP